MPARRLLVAGMLTALVATGCTTASHADETDPSGGWSAGKHNAITDVDGIRVGQVQRTGRGYLTGTTVIHAPDRAVAGVDVAGGAPGTRETALLSPTHSNPGANAVVLSGGSAYGLSTATGVMRWLERHHQGIRVGDKKREVVPIVPAAILFDLERGGDFSKHPTADWGYDAIAKADGGSVKQGNVGAGTGANAGEVKGGIGTASIVLPDGTTVGAIVATNPAGSPLAPDCSLPGSQWELDDEFDELTTPDPSNCERTSPDRPGEPMKNTTIAVVAVDAAITKAAVSKMSQVAHDGIARSIKPAHGLSDGDSVFALSTGKQETGEDPLAVTDADDRRALGAIYDAAATTLSRAITHAILEADTTHGMTSYCDTYPTAC